MIVIYILGSGRTGSTLLGQLLSAQSSMFFAGEVIDYWVRGFEENRLCGCGHRAHECEVWGPITKQIKSALTPRQIETMVRLRSGARPTRQGWGDVFHRTVEGAGIARSETLEAWGTLYSLIGEVSGASVIIDSSKFAQHASTLKLLPQVDLRLLHLVRDPRAVAHSWKRIRPIPDPDEDLRVPTFSSLGSAFRWLGRNFSARAVARQIGSRYALLRYEDFVRQPGSELAKTLRDLGFIREATPGIWPLVSTIPTGHAIWGNPSRFLSGEIALEEDVEWKTAQRRLDRWLIEAVTWPWRYSYGYR